MSAQTKSAETVHASTSRYTTKGRKLSYALTVIQQPQRARACGSGAKSSADRRPVDPPPVVKLQIFAGEGDKKEDITFSYSANFFLFATLETARQIAHGRAQPSPLQIPVLTGMPVSGMAYLDRPQEAGYFIFPDLSVRHEGSYVLSFNLYEETKDANDADAEPLNDPNKPSMPSSSAPGASFDWRLEVRSDPFVVYSAKKFPGLAESTTLSRTVAEQGCRVRIRRDVRMRRREKGGNDYEDSIEQDTYARGVGRPVEPPKEPYYRERSNSAASDDGRDSQHRMLEHPQYASYKSQAGTPEGTPHPMGQPHLGFGSQHSQHPQNHPPPQPPGQQQQQHQHQQQQQKQQQQQHQQHQQQQQQQQQQQYQPSHPVYQQQMPQQRGPPPPPAPPPAPQSQAQSHNYGYDRQQYPQTAYPSNPPRAPQDVFEMRRHSMAYSAPGVPQTNAWPPPVVEVPYNRPPSQHAYPHSPGIMKVELPPIMLGKLPSSMDTKIGSLSSPGRPGSLSSINPIAPGPFFDQRPVHGLQPLQHNQNGKRGFDDTFYSAFKPLRDGQRPTSAHHDPGAFEEDDNAQEAENRSSFDLMAYKRANGTTIKRPPPDSYN